MTINKNFLRKFDTSANLEGDTDIINGEWCFATDTDKIAIKKIDGTWKYIGSTEIWESNTNGSNFYINPKTTTDTLKIDEKFTTIINRWDVDSYIFQHGKVDESEFALYEIDSENGISFNCYSDDGTTFDNFSTDYAGKLTFVDEEISFDISNDDTSQNITWGDIETTFGRESFLADGLETALIEVNGNEIIETNEVRVALNGSMTAGSTKRLELNFASSNYLKIRRLIKWTPGSYVLEDSGFACETFVSNGVDTDVERYINIYNIVSS